MTLKSLPANRRLPEKKPALSASPRSARLDELLVTLPKAAHFFLAALLVVGVTTAGAWLLFRYVRSTPRFAIRHVVIEGSKRYPDEKVQEIAGVALGANVFACDVDRARSALEHNPWFQRAQVQRKLPGTLWIQVVEREAVMLVVKGGHLLLAEAGGQLFKKYEPGDPTDLVVMTGLDDVPETELTPEYIAQLVSTAQEIARHYERVFANRSLPLQEVHWNHDGGFDLLVGHGGVVMSLGKGPYRTKLERGAHVLAELERRKAPVSSIFLDNEAHPERVVARLR